MHEAQRRGVLLAAADPAALEAAEVGVVLLDASEPLTEQDQRVIAIVVEAGRALVLAFNKWDLIDEERRPIWSARSTGTSRGVTWAPRVNVSALTGRAVDKLAPALRVALAGWEQRIPTARLNAWLGDIVAATPPPVRGGKQPKILFATQADIRAAPVRHLHHRLPRGGLPPLHRAPAARGLRLRGHADRGLGQGPGEARPTLLSGVRDRRCPDGLR